jgi:hypothetical protein
VKLLESPPDPFPQKLGKDSTVYQYEGQFETRAKNIAVATQKVNGTILKPGDVFSFNKVVGPRTLANGFVKATEIFLGEMIAGVGGGICQVSSTLFVAVLQADLDVIERRAHSRPREYTKIGLDAMVAFSNPEVCKVDYNACSDLRFKNNYPFPIRISVSSSPSGTEMKLVASIEGAVTELPEVESYWSVLQRQNYKQRIRKGYRSQPTYKRMVQAGKLGEQGVRIVTVHRDGKSAMKKFYSLYAPIHEVWEVGREWDMAKTPWTP